MVSTRASPKQGSLPLQDTAMCLDERSDIVAATTLSHSAGSVGQAGIASDDSTLERKASVLHELPLGGSQERSELEKRLKEVQDNQREDKSRFASATLPQSPQGMQNYSPASGSRGSSGQVLPSRPGSSFSGFLEDFLSQHQPVEHMVDVNSASPPRNLGNDAALPQKVNPSLSAKTELQNNSNPHQQQLVHLPCHTQFQNILPSGISSHMILQQQQQQQQYSTLTQSHGGIVGNNMRSRQEPQGGCNSPGRRYFKQVISLMIESTHI